MYIHATIWFHNHIYYVHKYRYAVITIETHLSLTAWR